MVLVVPTLNFSLCVHLDPNLEPSTLVLHPAPRVDNVIEDMQDAGIALHESFGADIHDNSVNRAEYGIRLSVGAGNNHVYDNEFNNISGGEIRKK